MKFILTIEGSDAAVVGDGAEQVLARMIAKVAEQVRNGYTSGFPRNPENGSQIGHWEYTPEALRYPCTIEDAHCEDCGAREFVMGVHGDPECGECGGDLVNPDHCKGAHE